jgi:hypothetical protein
MRFGGARNEMEEKGGIGAREERREDVDEEFGKMNSMVLWLM